MDSGDVRHTGDVIHGGDVRHVGNMRHDGDVRHVGNVRHDIVRHDVAMGHADHFLSLRAFDRRLARLAAGHWFGSYRLGAFNAFPSSSQWRVVRYPSKGLVKQQYVLQKLFRCDGWLVGYGPSTISSWD